MPGTRRTPLARPSAPQQITPRAVELFVAMGKLRCTCPPPSPGWTPPCPGCDRWYDLHEELHVELSLALWEYPCVSRASPKAAGSTCWNEEIGARMSALKNAAKARRTASSSSLEEGNTNAEPAGHQDIT